VNNSRVVGLSKIREKRVADSEKNPLPVLGRKGGAASVADFDCIRSISFPLSMKDEIKTTLQ
jgi:hypothetical protein